MRNYTIRYGAYAGIYPIYESKEECKKFEGDVEIKRWQVDGDPRDFEKGDWVEAEDGYVVKLIYIKYYDKAKSDPRYLFRFPMGTFQVYYMQRRDKYRFPKFYAVYSQSSNGFGDFQSLNLRASEKDLAFFAKLLMEGFDMFSAYGIAFPQWRRKTSGQKINHLLKLIENRKFRKVIMASIKNLQSNIDRFISDDEFFAKLQEHWKHVKKGSAAELSAIKFVKEIKFPESKFSGADDYDPSLPQTPHSIQDAEVVKDDLPPDLKLLG